MKKALRFEISVMSTEHEEWQGKVTCSVSGEQCEFQSVLELIRFIEEKTDLSKKRE